MTLEELEQEAEALAEARRDPRTPAVVRRALLRPGGLTLRQWLELEEAGSPVLSGQWPVGDAAEWAQRFCEAYAMVFPGRELPPPTEVAGGVREMEEATLRSFCTVMPMRFPQPAGVETRVPPPDGLGWVARLLGTFVAVGWQPAEVLETPLEVLFMLQASLAAHEGAESVGQDYREREEGSGEEGKG